MLFLRHFNAEIRHLAPLFAAAENADREFHQGLKEGKTTLGLSRYKETECYRQTLECFRDATQVIDTMVSTALVQAKLGDLSQLPRLFAYIALPGRYYRSGYQRASIWRFLKRLPLDEKQTVILQGVILRQIETAGPEFREMSQAAIRVNSAGLRENVKIIGLRTEKDFVHRRVERLLARLDASLT